MYAHQGATVERLIGWGHPEIIDKLKYEGVTLFVDGTFSSKESDMYGNVIDPAIQATDQKLESSKVICDFEAGLIKAVLKQFPEAKALGRRMKRLRIPEPDVKLAMAHGSIDILAVIDKEKQWVRRHGPDLWNVDGIQSKSLPERTIPSSALIKLTHVVTSKDFTIRAKTPRRREKYTLPKKVMLPDK
ncbi:hypothetical protein PHMEG_0009262 [Phytophthora megakarya]|uniref:Uncharacterized protein n=1 Tax=Phytophthora megakarya TaxID=4795 RepID=A0A225WGP0_9STRA|nr:hypothetical protein PHMEG_0009262 [Phytophthora megakarya]